MTEKRIRFNEATLNEWQIDGAACVVCGIEFAPGSVSVPAGVVDHAPVFACIAHRAAERNGCPPWCGGDHLDGGVHRGVVGDTAIGDETVLVVILQTPDGGPSVAVSGPVIVQVAPDDHADAAALFALLGHDELADLVRRAARIVEDAVELAALEARAAEVVEDAGDAQADAACVVCGADITGPAVPIDPDRQKFACASHAPEPVRASVPGTWPNGEPAAIRNAAAEDEQDGDA